METPTTPSRPRSTRGRARNVDIFEQAGWLNTAASEEALSQCSSEPYYTCRPAGPSMESLSTISPTRSFSQPFPSLQLDHGSRGIYDSYHTDMPIGAVVVRNLDQIRRSMPPSKQSSRALSPTPYTIRSVASTHYLIEKEGLPIWIEKDPVWQQNDSKTDLIDSNNEKVGAAAPSTFTAREMLFIFNVCLAQFISLAGLAQTFAPLIVLSNSFGISEPGLMAWPTAAYSLTLGSCILPAGRLGDMYGHKKMILIGWVWFSMSSIICGFSTFGGFEMLTGSRALQGIGPALLIPNGLALFGRNFPMGIKRNMAISMFGGSGPLGVVSGAVFSSLLAQFLWWPWSFWIMGIVAGLISIGSYFALPPDNIKPNLSSGGKKGSQFDLPGCITGVGGLVLINFALNQAPIVGWSQPYIGVTLGIGVLLIGAFIYIELAVAQHPLIPLKGLKKDAALTLACIAAGWGSHGVWSYYMFLLFEQVRNHTPLAACAGFWPVAPIGLAAALSVGPLLKRFRVAHLMSTAMLCFVLACLFLAVAPSKQGYFPMTFLSIVVAPFGMNWSFPTGVILMSNAVHREHQGIAASLVATMVNYCISTGLGFAGSIDRYVTPVNGIIEGFRGAWYFGVGLAGLGFAISVYFIWQSRARK